MRRRDSPLRYLLPFDASTSQHQSTFAELVSVNQRRSDACRDTPLRHLVPFDASISLHRTLGMLLVVASLLHTGCHINNYIHQVWQLSAG